MKTDAQLLGEFAHARSEAAFTELVQRHLDLVYSAVIRQVGGDAHLAKDAAQAVFSDLARKAPSLLAHEHLGGWLYRAAHFAAAKIVRRERRRRDVEQEAAVMSAADAAAGEPDWSQLRSLLDAAMLDLSHGDREAVLLRFFHRRSFAEIGAKLAVSEDTARKRVERALGKLHALLARRGISSTAAGLGAVLAQNSVTGAPAGLATSIASHAVQQAVASAAPSFLQPLSGLLPTKSMVMLGFVAMTLGTGTIFYQSQIARADPAPAIAVAEPVLTAAESVLPPADFVEEPAPSPRAQRPIRIAAVAQPRSTTPPAPPPGPPVTETVAPPVAIPPSITTATEALTPAPPSAIASKASDEANAAPPSVRAPIEGPHILYIQQDKDWRLVADVEREVPFIAVNGKTEQAEPTGRDLISPTLPSLSGNGFILQPAKLFYPAVIQVDHVATRILAQQAERVVKTRMSLSFRASFNASAPIKRAFLALEVISKSGNHRFFMHELGDLQPNNLKYLSVDHVFEQGYEPVDYKIHVFTRGLEIMNSLMSREEIDHGLNDLVAFQLQKNPSDKPVPLVAPPPICPTELKEKNLVGQVVVILRVTADGRVENPQVTDSTQPAFAAATLEALSQWRFVPAAKDGRAFATKISLPFSFAP